MYKFKDTRYGDMTGQTYVSQIDVEKSDLSSLEGSPLVVQRGFYCSKNKLTNLIGGPKIVGDVYACSNNKLTSLEGAPTEVGSVFYCDKNKNLLDPRGEIIARQIKAFQYITDKGTFSFDSIKDEFEAVRMKSMVKSKGFRTLLGIK